MTPAPPEPELAVVDAPVVTVAVPDWTVAETVAVEPEPPLAAASATVWSY